MAVLDQAGLIRVVRTKMVRAIEANHYGRTARTYLIGDSHEAGIDLARDHFLQSAAREFSCVEDATVGVMSTLRYARMNSFIGPPLGGILLAAAFSLPFFFDAGTFAVAAALVLLIAGDFRPRRGSDAPVIPSSFWGDLQEGVKWLWGHRLFRPIGIVAGGDERHEHDGHRHLRALRPGGTGTRLHPLWSADDGLHSRAV